MSDNIDRLSIMLGKMQSDISHVKDSTDKMGQKLSDTHDNVMDVVNSTQSAHKRLDDMEPHVEDYKKIKQRSIGATAGFSFVFGGAGAYIAKLMGFLS